MTKLDLFVPRTYRRSIKDTDLVTFSVIVQETDLLIRATTNLKSKAAKLVDKYRKFVSRYIEQHPDFLLSLKPVDVSNDAPAIVKVMSEAGKKMDVGPMAAVAGAIAEFVGKDLLKYTPEIIVENGGDIFIKSLKKRIVGIYAGYSSFSGKIGLEIKVNESPLGICSSSGTVGHSLSFGKTDAAIVIAKSAALADAAATALGNEVKEPSDIKAALNRMNGIEEIKGAMIIIGEKMGIWGDIKLIPL